MQEIKKKHTWTEVLGTGYQYLVLDRWGDYYLAYWMVFCPTMVKTRYAPKEISTLLESTGYWSAGWIKDPESNQGDWIDTYRVFRLPKVSSKDLPLGKGKRQ
jgi:hypothetical protein